LATAAAAAADAEYPLPKEDKIAAAVAFTAALSLFPDVWLLEELLVEAELREYGLWRLEEFDLT
jgi:hypothetical protein